MKGRVSVYLLSAWFQVVGIGLALIFSGVPIYLLFIYWTNRSNPFYPIQCNGSPKNTFLNTQASLGYLFGRGAGSGNSEAFPGRPRRRRQAGLETLFNLVLEIYIY